MDHDLFPPAVTVTSGQRLVLSRGNGSLKSSCMVKLVESDWLEPQLAERGSSESDAAEFFIFLAAEIEIFISFARTNERRTRVA